MFTPEQERVLSAYADSLLQEEADTALSLTATWGTANAANSIQGLNYQIISLN